MRLIAGFLLVAASVAAQGQELPPAADSAITRAMKAAAENDTAAARLTLDSLVVNGVSALVRGEGAYWLTRFAGSSAEREGQLGMFVIDHPFSPRLPSALYELGMLELARNDRDRAAVHLSRYLTSTKTDTGRVTASLALGRLLLERGEVPRGCAVLLVGRSELPDGVIEIRNQFEFSIGRCHGVDTTSKVEVSAAPDTTPAPQRTGAYTVQVAAYETKAAADRLAATLRASGLEARVVGTSKPFRVRVGRYATRSDAEDASRRIDSIAKSRSLVVIVGPEER